MPASVGRLALLLLAACGQSVPEGQYGSYLGPFRHLVMPDGAQLQVYRIKYWTLTNGPPVLQLEYEAPFGITDTATGHAVARKIWPLFAPYVDNAHVSAAIITATNLERHFGGLFWTTSARHFGVVATRDQFGVWRFLGDKVALQRPKVDQPLAIIEPDGRHMPLWSPTGGGPR